MTVDPLWQLDRKKPSSRRVFGALLPPPIVKAMGSCFHGVPGIVTDPNHLEGSVLAHSVLAFERALAISKDRLVLLSAALHDIGKPYVRTPEHPLSFPRHSMRAMNMVRGLTCRPTATLSPESRMLLSYLVAYHYSPGMEKQIPHIARSIPVDFVPYALLAEANCLGRVSDRVSVNIQALKALSQNKRRWGQAMRRRRMHFVPVGSIGEMLPYIEHTALERKILLLPICAPGGGKTAMLDELGEVFGADFEAFRNGESTGSLGGLSHHDFRRTAREREFIRNSSKPIIAIDDGCLTSARRMHLLDIARHNGRSALAVFIDLPLETHLARISCPSIGKNELNNLYCQAELPLFGEFDTIFWYRPVLNTF